MYSRTSFRSDPESQWSTVEAMLDLHSKSPAHHLPTNAVTQSWHPRLWPRHERRCVAQSPLLAEVPQEGQILVTLWLSHFWDSHDSDFFTFQNCNSTFSTFTVGSYFILREWSCFQKPNAPLNLRIAVKYIHGWRKFLKDSLIVSSKGKGCMDRCSGNVTILRESKT